MIRKIISYAVSLTLLLSLAQLDLSITKVSAAEDAAYTRSYGLISNIIEEATHFQNSQALTRAEFVGTVARLMKIAEQNNEEPAFKDVSKNSDYYGYINAALQMNWISEGEFFFPDNPITASEAIKILVCAADRRFLAESKGGYPGGYVRIAMNIDLSDNINTASKTVSGRDLYVMLFNLLNTRVLSPDEIKSNGESYSSVYVQTEEKYMNTLYNVYEIEGIVSETSSNSIDYSYKPEKERNHICINGRRFETTENMYEMIGFYVTGYYISQSSADVMVYVNKEKKNQEIFTVSEDFILTENDMCYYMFDGRQHRANLESPYIIMYNGRAVSKTEIENISQIDADIRLLDNDNDGKYEFLFVDYISYCLVGAVDTFNGIIGDENDSSSLINVGTGENRVKLTDGNGSEITIFDINKNDVLAVKASKDNYIIEIRKVETVVNSSVTMITDERYIALGNTEYKLSDYMLKNYSADIKLGVSGIFTVDKGRIVLLQRGNGVFRYGYLIKAAKEGTFGNVVAKVYTQEGNQEIFTLADKVVVDGATPVKSENVLGALGSQGLIRYALNNEGQIKQIDLPENFVSHEVNEQKRYNNSLTRYSFDVSSFLYRSSSMSCMPYFNVNNTIVFVIPTDLDDEYSFKVGDRGMLSDNSSYSFSVYDINEYGTAGVLVRRVNSVSQTFSQGDNSYVVEKILYGRGADEEDVTIVQCWHNGKYYKFFMDSTVSIQKDSNTALLPGDVVRFKFNNRGYITAAMVDFDIASGAPKKNSYSNASFEGSNVAMTYQFGKAYSGDGSFIYLSNEKDAYGDWDYSFEYLKNFNINTTNIIKFDLQTKELIPIKTGNIKAYTSFGNENDFVIIRQGTFSPKMVIVYD